MPGEIRKRHVKLASNSREKKRKKSEVTLTLSEYLLRDCLPTGACKKHVIVSPHHCRSRIAFRRAPEPYLISGTKGLVLWVQRHYRASW